MFEKIGANGKVVIGVASEFTSEWTFQGKYDIPGAMRDTYGFNPCPQDYFLMK